MADRVWPAAQAAQQRLVERDLRGRFRGGLRNLVGVGGNELEKLLAKAEQASGGSVSCGWKLESRKRRTLRISSFLLAGL
jgi:hypothetical protein